MPNVNHNENILNTHLLEQAEQLLATAFFITVIEPFCYVSWLVIVIILSHSVGNYASFRILDTSATH